MKIRLVTSLLSHTDFMGHVARSIAPVTAWILDADHRVDPIRWSLTALVLSRLMRVNLSRKKQEKGWFSRQDDRKIVDQQCRSLNLNTKWLKPFLFYTCFYHRK